MKDAFKDRMKKYIEEMNGLTTEGNHSSRANIANSHYVKSTSFFETIQQQTSPNVIPLPKSRAQSPKTTEFFTIQRYDKPQTQRIQKKIESINQDCFRDFKQVSTRNPVPFDKKRRSVLNNIERDILSMSPTHRKKPEYLLSNIMKKTSNNTNKSMRGNQRKIGSLKEVTKIQDEMNMKQFMTNFSNPSYLKNMCEVLKHKKPSHIKI